MTLRLRIVGEHRPPSGQDCVTFGVGGGSLGRSADNDWVLPDERRYVSAHHARVHFRDGHYYLEDISTNGVYVNQGSEPLSKLGSGGYLLCQGDVLRIGAYQIEVSLDGFQPGDSALPSRIMAVRAFGGAAQTDIGAVLDLDDLLAVDPAAEPGESLPVLATAPVEASPAGGPAAHSAPERAEPDDTVARRLARLARSANRESEGPSHEAALQAFCRGAGLKPEQLPAQSQGLLALAGQLLRESLVGLRDLDRAQQQARSRLGIPPPSSSQDAGPDSGPSLGQSTVEELLLELTRRHDEHSLDAVRWLRERQDEVKARELALSQAVRVAFLQFLARLNPAELETRFARTSRDDSGAAYWPLFTTFYRNLLGPADQLPHTFLESLAEAYKDALQPNTHDMPRSHSGAPGSHRRRS